MTRMKALIDDEIVEGELVDDDMFAGGKKFIYDNCIISVSLITIIDE